MSMTLVVGAVQVRHIGFRQQLVEITWHAGREGCPQQYTTLLWSYHMIYSVHRALVALQIITSYTSGSALVILRSTNESVYSF